jgi:hypothetical protein
MLNALFQGLTDEAKESADASRVRRRK